MALTDWVQTVAAIYFAWQQNRIFERQNKIIAAQSRPEATAMATSHWWTSLRRYWPTYVMLAMIVLTGYDIYDRHHTVTIYEFDSPQASELVGAYAQEDNSACDMQVNGKVLLSLKKDYKVAISCFIYDGAEPILDAPNIQNSALYGIEDGMLTARVIFSDSYKQYRVDRHATGTHIAILLVPNGIEPNQFSTLRQARRLKAIIPAIRIASRPQ